jgi:hypothetical protein
MAGVRTWIWTYIRVHRRNHGYIKNCEDSAYVNILECYLFIYKSECIFVALLSGMFLGMYTINSLTP